MAPAAVRPLRRAGLPEAATTNGFSVLRSEGEGGGSPEGEEKETGGGSRGAAGSLADSMASMGLGAEEGGGDKGGKEVKLTPKQQRALDKARRKEEKHKAAVAAAGGVDEAVSHAAESQSGAERSIIVL